MNVLILYDTKYGFTKKCAEYLHDKLPDSTIHKLSESYLLEDFDKVLLGTFIDDGKVSDTMSIFLKKNKHSLLDRELGIFCSALDKKDYLNALQESLEPEIFYHAKKILCGGKVTISELNYFERRKLRKRINIVEDTENFYPDNLDELLE